jgi:DNA-binding MarR family transcriptional regulator
MIHDEMLGRRFAMLWRFGVIFMEDKLRAWDIHGPHIGLFMYISMHDGASQDDIARHFFKDKATITRHTKTLIDRGYIYRETDPGDRRRYRLHLTDKGKKVIPEIKKYGKVWNQHLLKDLSEEETRTFLKQLQKITNNASSAIDRLATQEEMK